MIAMNGYLEGDGGLQTSITTDPTLETWPKATIVAPHPPTSPGGDPFFALCFFRERVCTKARAHTHTRADAHTHTHTHTHTGFRDPARAIEVPPGSGQWYVAVGGGNATGAQVLLFHSNNASLSSFSPPTVLYYTPTSFATGDQVRMFECPDFFALGDKYVVFTSVEGDTQWLVGTLRQENDTVGRASKSRERQGAAAALTFVPEKAGWSDQGIDYYAAKTGAPAVGLTAASRRLLWAFNGWGGGVTAPACGRFMLLPRELNVRV
jgi:sucrose-6-phosphate hydrolase SacC (GH32 family)